jgi:hypothetical protein
MAPQLEGQRLGALASGRAQQDAGMLDLEPRA